MTFRDLEVTNSVKFVSSRDVGNGRSLSLSHCPPCPFYYLSISDSGAEFLTPNSAYDIAISASKQNNGFNLSLFQTSHARRFNYPWLMWALLECLSERSTRSGKKVPAVQHPFAVHLSMRPLPFIDPASVQCTDQYLRWNSKTKHAAIRPGVDTRPMFLSIS